MKEVEVCNKKVCNLPDNDRKIISCLIDSPDGLNFKTLSKLTQFKQSLLYKRLSILSKKGLIEKISLLWKISNGGVSKCVNLIKGNKIFELHNPAYVVKLLRVPEWWNKRKNRLIRLKEWQFNEVHFGKGESNPYCQIKNNNFVIQTYPESIIIIHRKRYYADNPYEVAIQMISDFYELWEWLEAKFRFKFFIDGTPQAELRGNDFNRLKDSLAEHCKKEGRRFLVEIDKNRKVWVDYSEPFGKEANYPEAQEILEKVTKDYLINKPMLNSELQSGLNQLTGLVVTQQSMISQTQEQLLEYQKQNKAHLKLIKEYRAENKAWRKHFQSELKTRKELSQKTIWEYK